MPDGLPVRVVPAARPAHADDVGSHHRGHHLQPRSNREGQQALPNVRGDLAHHHAHHVRHHRRRSGVLVPGGPLLVVLAHGGPLLPGLSWRTPETYHSADLRRGTATSNPTTSGATSEPAAPRSAPSAPAP